MRRFRAKKADGRVPSEEAKDDSDKPRPGIDASVKVHSHGNEINISGSGTMNQNYGPVFVQNNKIFQRFIDRKVSKFAKYDLVPDTERGPCIPQTRQAVLEELLRWCAKSNEQLYWMQGQPGTGKTTIMYSLCQALAKKRVLGASFFCSRNQPGCRDLEQIIPIIAAQLAEKYAPFKEALDENLRGVFDIPVRPELQLRDLIIDPWRAGKTTLPENIIVVLDAPEISDGDYSHFLRILLDNATSLPFKVVLASRPEPSIRSIISKSDSSILSASNLDKVHSDEDISIYLRDHLGGLPYADIDYLENLSGSVFAAAAALVRYLKTEGGIPPTERLTSLRAPSDLSDSFPDVWDRLEATYRTILSGIFQYFKGNEPEEAKRILYTVICAREPMTVQMIAILWEMDEALVANRLNFFHSLLTIPAGRDEPITVFHATVYSFMTKPQQSESFWCQPEKFNGKITKRCLEITMDAAEGLKQNICKLPRRSVNRNIRPQDIEKNVPPLLHYSCCFWAEHWKLSDDDERKALRPLLSEFLYTHIFHWFECLSVTGRLEVSTHALDMLLDTLSVDDELFDLVYHSSRFINVAFGVIRNSCLEAYSSALEFIPTSSPLRQHYKSLWGQPEVPRAICGIHPTWAGPNTVITNNIDTISSIVISPDGNRVFSRVESDAVHAWNVRTRELEYSLKVQKGGHLPVIQDPSSRPYVAPVAISANGNRVVSGFFIGPMRVWDTETQDPVRNSRLDEVKAVNTVAFSPDGNWFCSGGNDGTIHVWQSADFTPTHSLKGHEGAVLSVCFGPNSNQVVSGSQDKTACIWSLRSGVKQWALDHIDAVSSVAASASSGKIITGSYDSKVRVWDKTGKSLSVLTGHGEKPVRCVALFPDGTKVTSGGEDGSVCVWDIESATMLFLFSRSHPITSVAVFPDGSGIASSAGTEVSIWNFRGRTRVDQQAKESSLNSSRSPSVAIWPRVESMVFSPDGDRVLTLPSLHVLDTRTLEKKMVLAPDETKKFVIGTMGAKQIIAATKTTLHVWRLSDDGATVSNSLRIPIPGPSLRPRRDIQASSTVHVIMSYDHACSAVDISSDGRRIVSASNDFTVWVWCAETGERLLALDHPKPYLAARAAFSKDGLKIVTSCNKSAIYIWDPNTGDKLSHISLSLDLGSIAFSADDRHIVGSRHLHKKEVLIWDASGTTPSQPLHVHDGFTNWTTLSNGDSYAYKDGWIWQVKGSDMAPSPLYWIPLHYQPSVRAYGPIFTLCEGGVQACLGRKDGMVTLIMPN